MEITFFVNNIIETLWCYKWTLLNSLEILDFFSEVAIFRLFKISQSRLELWQKTHPKYIKNVHRGNHKSNIFSGEIPRTHLTRRASPSRAFPLPPDHFQRRGDGPELGLIQFLIWVKHWRFLIRNMNEIKQPKIR